MNENKITQPVKKESALKSKPWISSLLSIVIVFGALGGFLYFQAKSGTVTIEDSELSAPVVTLSSSVGGTLNAVYVTTGQQVAANSQVALVGTNTVSTKEAGTVSNAPSVLGGFYNAGQTILTVIATDHMRVLGAIEEINF